MNKTIPVLADVYRKRRDAVAKLINEREGIVIFGNTDTLRNALDNVYPFRQDSNMYYLTGIKEQDSVLLIYKDTQKKIKSTVFVQEKDPEKEKWTGYRIGTEKAAAISGADSAEYTSSLDSMIGRFADMASVVYIN